MRMIGEAPINESKVTHMTDRLDAALAALPRDYPGPGGAVAVIERGTVIARHAWGWADSERRVAFTPATPFLMCSITKHFTCALLLDRFEDPTELDEDLKRRLADLTEPAPGILDLCHNQSGLRDYWAVAMLCGAPVEGRFYASDASRLIGRTRTLQFQPGTRYSYANQNFRLLSDIIERRLDRPFDELLRTHVLGPAGMTHARLNPDTAAVEGGTVGYEGSVETGFRPAVNRIVWTGDAGLAASLDDMIAWETQVDATRDDPGSLYARLSAPTRFRDGTEASYGHGLSRAALLGHKATSHGGALRGWRSFRAYLPEARVSVVVMFNHMADARRAALDVLGAVAPARAPAGTEHKPDAGSVPVGRYEEPETGLAVRIARDAAGTSVHFGTFPERLEADTTVRLRVDGDGVWMDRPGENQSSRLAPVGGEAATDIEGVFHCAEIGADLTCVSAGGVLYGAFSGFLGIGAMQGLIAFGPDRWLLPCPRALDQSPPGDWTLRFERDEAGRIASVVVGCWLARGLRFVRA
jgi:D-aminopeptidase